MNRLILFVFFIFIFVLPFIALADDEIKITDIKAASGREYKVGDGGLKVGIVYYIDRTYVVNTMPKEM